MVYASRSVALIVAVLLALPARSGAQGTTHQHDASAPPLTRDKLGTIHFPTSATGAAQADFLEGVLYLHSFEYESARAAFRRAQQQSPGFAMAYWGDAETWNHPVWNQRAADSARAALARLAPTVTERAAKAPTAREKAWLNTVEVLYGEGPKPTRDSLYLRSIEALVAAYPDDESRTFLALAWLGLNQGDRRVSDYMKAGAIAQQILAHSPDHPGAAHFVIHAFDDPDHAVLGLDAARAYSGIAPAAAHAQHMTTHIFLALGMWPENNAQNRIALDATRGRSGHYAEWLAYGFEQQGRYREAKALVDTARAAVGRAGWGLGRSLPIMRAAYIVERGDWAIASDRALIEGRETFLPNAAVDAWLYAMGAALRHDAAAASAGIARLRDIEGEQSMETRGSAADRQVTTTLVRLAESADAAGRGDTTRALALLVAAQATLDSAPVAFGPPTTPMLVGEYRAELLLGASRAREAMVALQGALKANPGRSRTLALLVRSASAAGDAAVAAQARTLLARNWAKADDGGVALRALVPK